jgi:hypothetical protein
MRWNVNFCHGGQMATDTRLLMGEIIEDPEGQQKDVEQLLLGFLRALIEEQKQGG